MAIKRVWHGWTTPENADKYQDLLHNEIFRGIEAKNIPGYQSIELLRSDGPNEVAFVTIMPLILCRMLSIFKGKMMRGAMCQMQRSYY